MQQGYSHKFERLYSIANAYHFLVELCESGYGDWLVEYDNDFDIRELIERILQSAALNDYPEFKDWKSPISDLDVRLQVLFLPNHCRTEGQTWWTKGILSNGVDYYAQDVEEIYGLRL